MITEQKGHDLRQSQKEGSFEKFVWIGKAYAYMNRRNELGRVFISRSRAGS